jgi:LAS superfamily LD-carboxypeptidase LdcB
MLPSRAEIRRNRAALVPISASEAVTKEPDEHTGQPWTARFGFWIDRTGSKATLRTRWASIGVLAGMVGMLAVPMSEVAIAEFDNVTLASQVMVLGLDYRGDGASRAGSREYRNGLFPLYVETFTATTDIAEVISEQLDIPVELDSLSNAIEAINDAELVLTNERRATPELAEEIRGAVEDLREAMKLVSELNEDDQLAQELLRSHDAGTPQPRTTVPESPQPAPENSHILPELDSVPEPLSHWNNLYDSDYLATLSETELQAQLDQFAYDLVMHYTERLEGLLAEDDVPVPVAEPRPFTVTEQIQALVVEAQADGARLHTTYAYSFDGMRNGHIPSEAMQSLTWAPNHMLRPDAAAQFERLNEAFRAQFGVDIHVTSSYRSFSGQVSSRARFGRWAATPGTSNHGWGVAVDLSGGINRFRTVQHQWMQENAPAFGWIHPDWARQGGSLPEPWHWEFWGTPCPETGEPHSPGILRGHGGCGCGCASSDASHVAVTTREDEY